MNRLAKIVALLLSFVLLAGSLCSCGIIDMIIPGDSTNDGTNGDAGNNDNGTTDDSGSNNDGTNDDSGNNDEEADNSSSNKITTSDTYVPGKEYDIVVYGDTAAAVIAAVAASRQGATVALVAPNKQLGGMLAGGLFETDLGNTKVIGGMSREFFMRNAVKKGETKANAVDWYFEPHVAEEIFADMINETKKTIYPVEVFLGERLLENAGVVMSGATIKTIICESGKEFSATNFIDACYEGDLMAQAGVTYTYGREGREVYGETLAGVVDPSVAGASNHNFKYNILARDENGNLKYQEVSEEPLAPVGTGDTKIQAYNFRVCMTNDKNNMIPVPKPEGYDPARYALLADYIDAWVKAEGKAPTPKQLFGIGHEVNNKCDFNNKGAFSTDYIGGNYNYPDSTYAEREEIWNEHYKYVVGLLYFLTNDTSVHKDVRAEMSKWGLPKDEYVETDNWTFQLYVREGRRMIGEYVMTQADVQKGGGVNLQKSDSIGMGSYKSDSHNVQRYITADGYIRNEGNMEVQVDPYEIPYRMILPQRAEVDNLLVSCTFSASHVAYSTIRMEPQYMIIGEAAGRAAAISVQDKVKVHDIDVSKLQAHLIANDAVLTLTRQELMNREFIEDFNNNNKWTKANASGCAVTVLQNDSYITLKRSAMSNYGYITRNNFTAPTENFTVEFRAKLNGKGKVEFAIRGTEYFVQVVLTLDGDKVGTVSNAYVDPTKTKQLDTSVWHDYKIVVNKGTDGKYSYDMYVDGELAWENATYTTGFGTSIFKIGMDGATKTGGQAALNVDIDSVSVKINKD